MHAVDHTDTPSADLYSMTMKKVCGFLVIPRRSNHMQNKKKIFSPYNNIAWHCVNQRKHETDYIVFGRCVLRSCCIGTARAPHILSHPPCRRSHNQHQQWDFLLRQDLYNRKHRQIPRRAGDRRRFAISSHRHIGLFNRNRLYTSGLQIQRQRPKSGWAWQLHGFQQRTH